MQYVFFGSGPVGVTSFRTLRSIFPFSYVVTKSTTIQHINEFVTSEKVIIADTKAMVDEFVTTNIKDNSVGILIDFGVIISAQSIQSFSHGIVNSHFSLLPQLRGAAPIAHAILDGLQTTGVSLMKVDTGMDTGDIIAQATYTIPPHIYVDELTKNLIDISNEMLKEMVPEYINGDIVAIPQSLLSEETTYADKIVKADGRLHKDDSIQTLDKKVRAYAGWPGVKASLQDMSFTIERGEILTGEKPKLGLGTTTKGKTKDGTKAVLLHLKDGVYAITQLKPDGKKSMTAEAFIAGYSDKLN